MESYQEFYEAFSLNPKNWFAKEDDQLRSKARSHASTYIKQLKDLLKSKGYTIQKSDRGSYTVRATRLVGIDPKDTVHDKNVKNYKEGPLSIPYIRVLFTLAHEVGHVLQWNDETDTKHKFMEFWDQIKDLEEGSKERDELVHIHKLWYELNAWVEGMQFIPVEYKKQYKKFAYDSYNSYMNEALKSVNRTTADAKKYRQDIEKKIKKARAQGVPYFPSLNDKDYTFNQYTQNMLLRSMLYQLNFTEQS